MIILPKKLITMCCTCILTFFLALISQRRNTSNNTELCWHRFLWQLILLLLLLLFSFALCLCVRLYLWSRLNMLRGEKLFTQQWTYFFFFSYLDFFAPCFFFLVFFSEIFTSFFYSFFVVDCIVCRPVAKNQVNVMKNKLFWTQRWMKGKNTSAATRKKTTTTKKTFLLELFVLVFFEIYIYTLHKVANENNPNEFDIFFLFELIKHSCYLITFLGLVLHYFDSAVKVFRKLFRHSQIKCTRQVYSLHIYVQDDDAAATATVAALFG